MLDSKTIKLNINQATKKFTKNEKCDLGVGFDDTFKANNHILYYIEPIWNDWLNG